MKNRLHFIIPGVILIAAFIVGSILDLTISQSIFQGTDFGLGKFVSAVGLIPGYGVLAFFGGILFAIALKQIEKKWLKVILIIASVVCFGTAVYFSGKEFFSINGYYQEDHKTLWLFLGMLISAVVHGFISFGGYRVGLKNENTRTWIVIAILLAAIFLALVPGSTLLKSIFHRPRYRLLIEGYEGIEFHQWWQPFPQYKDYLSFVDKENFKSFPSGHAAASMVLAVGLAYLPVFVPSYKKHQALLFYIGFGYSLFVSITRILVGAHFVSDVAMGSILTLGFFVIANEIILRKNLLLNEQN